MQLRLQAPRPEHEAEHRRMMDEWARDGGMLHPSALRIGEGDYARYLARIEAQRNPETAPAGLVPSELYFLMDGERILGATHIRTRLNRDLLATGGHIGYGIRPCERGKGYAKAQLALALERCRALGMPRALVCCDVDNNASAAVIRACGGVCVSRARDEDGEVKRHWIELNAPYSFFEPGILTDGVIDLRVTRQVTANPARGWLNGYLFAIYEHGRSEQVGSIDLRLGYNENIYYGGNIGYAVLPAYRGHRYAARAVRILARHAPEHGLHELYITMNPDNEASRKSCELADGQYLERVTLPLHNDMYARGEREKLRYRVAPEQPHVREIYDGAQRSAICHEILRHLPDWFGNEAALEDYAAQAAAMPLWAAFDVEQPVGFVALKPQTPYACEISVMGVRQEYHHQGIGRRLIELARTRARALGARYLTVKTLDASHPDQGYARTRLFYAAMGFVPLETLPTLWDEANPCLMMIQSL